MGEDAVGLRQTTRSLYRPAPRNCDQPAFGVDVPITSQLDKHASEGLDFAPSPGPRSASSNVELAGLMRRSGELLGVHQFSFRERPHRLNPRWRRNPPSTITNLRLRGGSTEESALLNASTRSLMEQHQRLFYIQWLRALAAAGVVLLHAQMEAVRFSASTPAMPTAIAEYGRYGVDLFFVISGFVIFYTNYPRNTSAGIFLSRRFGRIIPLYWTLTLLAFALRFLLPDSLFVSTARSVDDLLLSLIFLSGHHPIIGAGWTLEFEMFFYALTALLIAIAGKRWRIIVYLLVALSLTGPLLSDAVGPLKLFVSPLLLEFVLGLLAAELFCTGRVRVLALVVVVIALSIAWREGWESILWAGVPFAAIVYGAAKASGRASFKNINGTFFSRFITEAGNASYSIYLIQFFTLPLSARVTESLLGDHSPDLILVVSFCTTIALGRLCYVWLERPSRSLLRGLAKSTTGEAAVAVSSDGAHP